MELSLCKQFSGDSKAHNDDPRDRTGILGVVGL